MKSHAIVALIIAFIVHGKSIFADDQVELTGGVATPKKDAPHEGDAPRDRANSRSEADQARIANKTRAILLQRQAKWKATAVRLVHALDSKNPDIVRKAEDELAAINDPAAIAPLVNVMTLTGEQNRRRILEIISAMPHSDGTSGLAAVAVLDPSPVIRDFALDCLRWRASHSNSYRSVFEQALRSGIRQQISNAAEALAELDDQDSTPALIDALVCSVRVGERWQADTDYRESLIRTPGGGFVHSASGRIRLVPVMSETENEPVLKALKRLSPVDFGYDKAAWNHWWSTSGNELIASPARKRSSLPTLEATDKLSAESDDPIKAQQHSPKSK